jgi:hypothetical protein
VSTPLAQSHIAPVSRNLLSQLRTPRIRTILTESRTRVEDSEVKSEAAFQRLITSGSELPAQPRVPRAASDRGRYPEEAGHEEETPREDNSSDDDVEVDDQPFAFQAGGTEPITISKSRTATNSVNGDEFAMSIPESPGASSIMDVDMVSLLSSVATTLADTRLFVPAVWFAVTSTYPWIMAVHASTYDQRGPV